MKNREKEEVLSYGVVVEEEASLMTKGGGISWSEGNPGSYYTDA